jgi:hypothetical protein
MIRQNLLSDPWDGDNREDGTRHRIFWLTSHNSCWAAVTRYR